MFQSGATSTQGTVTQGLSAQMPNPLLQSQDISGQDSLASHKPVKLYYLTGSKDILFNRFYSDFYE